MRPAGGNHRTLKKYVRIWGISVAHFDPLRRKREALRQARAIKPLHEVLVQNSTYSRGCLKRRLYATGLKQRR